MGIKEIKQMLLVNHNIILHGAPGTGKTYLAKEIAKAMCDVDDIKKLEDSGQFKMVQFHPSYDYTDFVEGLRPTGTDNNGNIIFSRQDGVFKKFLMLSNVKKSLFYIDEKDLRRAWDNIVSNKESAKIKLRGGEEINISDAENGKITVTTVQGGINQHEIKWEKLKEIATYFRNIESLDNMTNIDNDIRSKVGGCDTSKYWAVLHYLYESINPSFIFLIDEINRGDMSKIFGELFYAIDPGYRGEDGKIDTQYQNLVAAQYKDENGVLHDDPFHKGFYVPDNVYIIGTMNDIDRSVESMDFAMRRRFQFIEVTAEDRAEGMGLKTKKQGEEGYDKTEAYNRMTNLNNCIISKEIGLSKAYQIGGSYFLSNEKDDKGNRIPIKDNFDAHWKYRLEGLLREYLRGEEESEIKKKIAILERAFKRDDIYTYKEETEEIEMVTPVANQVASESSNE